MGILGYRATSLSGLKVDCGRCSKREERKKKILKAPASEIVQCTRYLLPEVHSQTFFFSGGVCDLIRPHLELE